MALVALDTLTNYNFLFLKWELLLSPKKFGLKILLG